MPEDTNKAESLQLAGDDAQPIREVPPLEQSFPHSAKVTAGDLQVPFRLIELGRGEPPVTVVTVRGGQVERVFHRHDDSEREVPARDGSLSLYWTVDELFDKLAAAYASDAVVRAEFDQASGFPQLIFIDYDPGFVGDETDLRLTELTRL